MRVGKRELVARRRRGTDGEEANPGDTEIMRILESALPGIAHY